MFNGRIGELLIILLIAFVIFGSNRLTSAIPEIARSIRSFFDVLSGKDQGEDSSDIGAIRNAEKIEKKIKNKKNDRKERE